MNNENRGDLHGKKFWKSKPINLNDFLYIICGAIVQAIALRVFLIPSLLVSGGVSGAAQVINYFTNWPIGLMILIGNLPLFVIGWRYLGGSRFAIRTILAIIAISLVTDSIPFVIDFQGVTHDLFLNSLYGGVIYGIGLGLVYRGKGTSGGSDIIGMLLFHRLGFSMSQAYMATDALVVLAGGLAFSWEHALYGMIVIYISGISAEMVSEGTGVFRTMMIVTCCPEKVSKKIMQVLERGVTILPATGAYTGDLKHLLLCVVARSEVNQAKALVYEADEKAFMVIGQAHEAFGEGFKRYEKRM